MRFREGDIVKISKKSRWYGLHSYNPKDVEGRIVSFTPSIRVRWSSNNETSYYEESDLRLVRRE